VGHYIGLRFTAKLRPEFVHVVDRLLDVGKSTLGAWHVIALETRDAPFLLPWSEKDRADQIPFGYPQDMPLDWDSMNALDGDVWSVCCATKSESTLRYFLEEVLIKMSLEIPFCEVCIAEGHPDLSSSGVPQMYVIDPAMRSLAAALLEVEQLQAAGFFGGSDDR
jgi:hypothetical protein